MPDQEPTGSGGRSRKLETTKHPGIYRRHDAACERGARCDCAYVVVWRHRGRQHTASYRTLAEAREAKGNRDAGDRRPVGRVTLGDYYAQWIVSYSGRTSRGFSERSRALYRVPLERHALPAWGSWKLADVEPLDVRGLFLAVRDGGASAMELKQLRSSLSAMFSTAVEDGVIRSNPIHRLRLPAALETPEEKPKAMTRQELALVLGAFPEQWRVFFELLAHTGLRISEAIGLVWENVDLGTRPHVKVREQFYNGERSKLKSKHSRRDIPLSAGMAARLLELRRDNFHGPRSPVFQSRTGGELSEQNLRQRVMRPTTEALGMSWVTPHTFRHTCASLLFANGKNVKQVQEWLGHADAAFTLRTYVHLMDEGLGDADFLDSAVLSDPSQVNTGSTQRPETAANRTRTRMQEIAP